MPPPPKKPSRLSTQRSGWTAEINIARASQRRVGVSHAELLTAFEPMLQNLQGPVAIVTDVVAPADGGRQKSLKEVVLRSVPGGTTIAELPDIAAATSWAQTRDEPISIVAYLALWRISRASLSEFVVALPSGSRLFFVEPTAGIGGAGRIQAWGRAVFIKRIGLSFHVDVPAVLRQVGWQATSVLRFTVGYPGPLMTFVAGESRPSR